MERPNMAAVECAFPALSAHFFWIRSLDTSCGAQHWLPWKQAAFSIFCGLLFKASFVEGHLLATAF